MANALVCKTSIRRFNPGPVLHIIMCDSGSSLIGHPIPFEIVRWVRALLN